MHTRAEYSQMAEEALEAIKYPDVAPALYEPIVYTFEGGGKRLRPSLLFAVNEACGRNPRAVEAQGAAIEMFHNFTLLHDDVMDNADMRRGRPTVYRRFGVPQAILSGDAMLTLASQLMAENLEGEKLSKVLSLFNRTAMEVYQGQQLDLDFEEAPKTAKISEADYLEMIRLKTAVLLACSCCLGAILAEADEEEAHKFYNFGLYLGMAFQLQDDYLDTFGDPATFGKEIGGDILNEKKTWFWLRAIEAAPDKMRQVLDQRLSDHLKIEAVRDIYSSLNLPDLASQLISSYTLKAEKSIESITRLSSTTKKFFIDLAKKASTRSH